MNRLLATVELALLAAGGAVLALAWRWNGERHREGRVVVSLDRTHGLHDMDLRLLGLAAALWTFALVLRRLGRISRARP